MTRGSRIKKARTDANLSQVELAQKIHVSKQTLYKYENDVITNIPSDKISAIASVCGCTPGFLMGWEDDHEDIQQKLIENFLRQPKLRELLLFAGGVEPEEARDQVIDAVISALSALRKGGKT